MDRQRSGNSSTKRHYANILVLVLVDYIAVVLAQILSHNICLWSGKWLMDSFVFTADYQFIYIPAVFILCIGTNDGYVFNRPSVNFSRDVFRGLLFSILMCGILLFAMHDSLLVSRTYAAILSVTVIVLVAVLRYGTVKFLKTKPWLKEDMLLIGAGKTAERIVKYFDNDLCYRYRIIGILDDDPVSQSLTEEYPLLGNLSQTIEVIQREGINTVLVAIPGMELRRMNEYLAEIRPYVRNIIFAPDLVGTPMGRVHIHTLFSQRIAIIKSYNDMARLWNKIIKRSFDLVLVLLFMPLIVPILLILAIIVKLDSPGPVFFNGIRMGEGGKDFACYKFRSMYVDGDERLKKYLADHPEAAAEWQEFAKLRGYDPRVTRCGKWMRRFSLDELPQLINVLEGTMSLVGPRPYLPREKEQIGENLDTIVLCKPGITGFWQVNGRNDVSFASRVAMDVWYVNNWSLDRDMLFLLKTIKIVLGKSGAY